MTNQIPTRQNEELQLRRLLAQRRLYARAKRILAWQMLVTVALVAVWSFVVLWAPGLKVYAALYGIVAVLLDIVVFAPWQNSLKHKAAGIQELFDCDVLGLPWQQIKAGSPPEPETVAEYSRQCHQKNYEREKLRNWYPLEAGELPLAMGRIICQRVNCWWDAKLRRRYAVWVLASTTFIFLFAAIVGLVGHLSFESFVLAEVLPFSPVLVIGVRQFLDQRQAAGRLDELRRQADRIWTEALSCKKSEEQLTTDSRSLQDEVFESRQRNPLIFDWTYRALRDEHEELMNTSASDLLKQARTALASSGLAEESLSAVGSP